MKRCKKCGKIHHDSVNFCSECGANIENSFTYICNHCGRLYDEGAVICPKCHAEPDVQLPSDTNSAKEIPEVAAQKAGELNEKAGVIVAAATGAASSLLKTASEKASEVGKKPMDNATVSTQPEDSKNRKLIAMIVAAVVICGLGGYFLFGRSSSGEEAAVITPSGQIAKVNVPNLNQNAKPIEKPTPPPPLTVKLNTARNAFISFHTAITNKQLADAYNILSPDYQKFVRGYNNFARGYATTLRSDVVELNTIQEDNNSAVLTYRLRAEDQVESGKITQYFIGKARLLKINGQWRIDSTEAKRASQSSQASVNNSNSTVSDTALKKTVGTITGNDVNVRKGPGIDYTSLGVFFKGDKVRVVDSDLNSVNETWYKIEYDNPTVGLIVGWVRSDFINLH